MKTCKMSSIKKGSGNYFRDTWSNFKESTLKTWLVSIVVGVSLTAALVYFDLLKWWIGWAVLGILIAIGLFLRIKDQCDEDEFIERHPGYPEWRERFDNNGSSSSQ